MDPKIRDYNWAVSQAITHRLIFGGDMIQLIADYQKLASDITANEEAHNEWEWTEPTPNEW